MAQSKSLIKMITDISTNLIETITAPSQFKFLTGLYLIPQPQKANHWGEDAVFYSDTLLSVADGVGGWSTQGVDAANYSRCLIDNIRNLHETQTHVYAKQPKKLICDAA